MTGRNAHGRALHRFLPARRKVTTRKTQPTPDPPGLRAIPRNFPGRRFGFCTALCNIKSIADPDAQSKFIAIYLS